MNIKIPQAGRSRSLIKIGTFTTMNDEVDVYLGRYAVKPHNLVVTLINSANEYPYAHCTYNHTPVAFDEIIVKTHGFHHGLSEDLFGTGLFEKTGRDISSGYIYSDIWKVKGD